MEVHLPMRLSGLGLPQLPAGYSKALDSDGLGNIVLREASGKAQSLTNRRRWQDIVHQGVNPPQCVRL
ncbi:hypothetical protein [Streptomyces triculaminicus]|uniref:hypothetical protein n=1 Tax=Streptomyces triculaminicus TaxID=2816232 RepID=UPI0037CEED2E